MHLAAKRLDGRRICARIEPFVLLPSCGEQAAVGFEVALLNGAEHLQSVLLHIVEQGKVFRVVEEHAAHDFGKDILGRARDAGVVKQMAGRSFGRGKKR